MLQMKARNNTINKYNLNMLKVHLS